MPIDMQSEQLVTFAEAVRCLPGRVHISTVHRWQLRGCRGIRLESLLVGGVRYTSREALARFVQRLTSASERRETPEPRSAHERELAIRLAKEELESDGI